jgi:mono/diheme cytochrome c family protein
VGGRFRLIAHRTDERLSHPSLDPASEDALTEVPEHLLKRSQDRRSALGLGGDGGDAAPSADTPAAASTSVAPAVGAAPVAAAAPVEKVAPPPEPVPAYVQASEKRKRIPIWAMPVLAFLPVWAVVYAQSLSAPPSKEVTQLAAGAALYSPCASCHGASGGGGTGRKFADGEVVKTFPNIAGQLAFVRGGDAGNDNKPYGNPAREGGQHVGPYNGAVMPAFPKLTDKELLEVVRHERETLGGEKDGVKVDAAGNRMWPNGKPMLDSAGKLVWDDGTPMFDASGKLTKPVDETQAPTA